MKKLFALTSLFFFVASWSLCQEPVSQPKKKIIIFWSKGGGCHKAMVDALVPMLKDLYNVTPVNILEDVLSSVDPIRAMTHGKRDGEDLYNYLLSHDWIRTTTLLVEFGKKGLNVRYNKIVALLNEYLERKKPDMVISVIPLFNSHLGTVCEKLNIPFLLNIMDNVHLYFIAGKPLQDPMKFRCTIAIDDALWRKNIKKARFNTETIKGVGFPLRKDFFEKKNISSIKKDFEVPQNKPIVMILMGGAGSAKTVQYVRKLTRIKEPMHVLVCCGRSEQLKKQLEAIKKPEGFTMKAIGFTSRISDLMAISDVLITKSGPASLYEAFESKLPILVDRIGGTVPMERLLVQTVIDRELGDTIVSLRRLPEKLKRLLHDNDYREKIKKNMAEISNKDFEQKIKKIIADFFADREKAAEKVK